MRNKALVISRFRKILLEKKFSTSALGMARLRLRPKLEALQSHPLDIQDPSRTGFNVAKEILGADVTYINVIETFLRP
jgi:hypothetical protein